MKKEAPEQIQSLHFAEYFMQFSRSAESVENLKINLKHINKQTDR